MTNRKEYEVPGLNEPLSHYTDAVRYGDFLFISGVTPVNEHSEVVGGDDVTKQAQQLFLNMEKILKAAGATFADILKVTVFLTDINDRPKINPVRQRFFGNSRPASTLVEVSRLAIPGAKVEIEAVVGCTQ